MKNNNGAILSDGEIREALLSGELEVSGQFPLYIGPSSMDLHLDNKAKIISKYIDDIPNKIIIDDKNTHDVFREENDWHIIQINPGEFHLWSTTESIKFPPGIAGFVQGRSSIARLGLNIHNAGFADPGFEGTITLEVTNLTSLPIIVTKGTRICQMVFIRTGKPSEIPYGKRIGSKYQGQSGPTMTKVYEDYGTH